MEQYKSEFERLVEEGKIEAIDGLEGKPIEKFAAMYDAEAESYEADAYGEKINYALPETMLRFFQNHDVKSGTVLDLGCGPGVVGNALQKIEGANFELTGVDISPGMAQQAIKAGYEKVILGRIEEAVEQEGSYDHIVSLSALYYVSKEDIEKVILSILAKAKKTATLSFEEITKEFSETVRQVVGDIPLESHVGALKELNLPKGWSVVEDVMQGAWTSPRVGQRINAEMVMLKKAE
ncbi:MAG: class I SAM-dependent methyltransferase [Candidatus Paceibacterota bacterium]